MDPNQQTLVAAPVDGAAASGAADTGPSGGMQDGALDSELQQIWDRHHDGPDDDRLTVDAGRRDASIDPESRTRRLAAPLSWSAEHKARWDSVPPELQAYIAQRDKETHDAITQAGQRVKGWEPFDQLIQHHRGHFERYGITPAQSFAYLLDAQQALEQNPLHGLVQIGLQYGIDLRPLLQGQSRTDASGQAQGANGRQAAIDPAVQALHAEVRQLKDYLSEQQRLQQDTETAELQRTIADFATDKPYFDEVRPIMAALLRFEQASTLADAYDMAVNAKPDIRQRILADQRSADETRRQTAAAAAAAQARKDATVNVRSDSATRPPKTMDDTLQEIARKAYGRAA
jgi:hypothetical protein